MRAPEELIDDALTLLEQVPDELLVLALREHPVVRRIIDAERKNSIRLESNFAGAWAVEVKAYVGDDLEAGMAKVTAIANAIRDGHPAATPKK
jgi:hypothetical protein